jgi:carboxypeptidase PM20D1
VTELAPELRITPVLREFFERAGEKSPVFRKLLEDPRLPGPLKESPYLMAMLQNTATVTKLHAADIPNYLAPTAEAILDCRLLPGTPDEEMVEVVRRAVDDERVAIDILQRSGSGESSWGSAWFEGIERALSSLAPGSITAPFLLPASTDLSFFREKGIPCYGIFPGLFTFGEIDRIHGANERVSLENLGLAYRATAAILERWLAG